MKNTNQSAQEVDVEKLAEQYIIDNTTAFDNWKEKAHAAIGFKDGYNQALQSKAVFSLEFVKAALSEAFKASQEGYQITADEIIQSLTPSKEDGYVICKCGKKKLAGYQCINPLTQECDIQPLTSTPIQTKGREVEFAEWMEDERWWFEDNRKWHNSKHEQGQTGITTSELFQLFLTTNPSNKGA